MSRFLLRRGFVSLMLLALLGTGLALLTRSVTSQEDPQPGPTRTAQELSDLSDRLHATDIAGNSEVADGLIASHQSVANFPRGELSGDRADRPPSYDGALQMAVAVHVGRVQDQFIERGIEPVTQLSTPYLVSVLATADGSVRVAQLVSVLRGTRGIVTLGFEVLDPLLTVNKSYAVLVQSSSIPDATEVIRGHAYIVHDDGRLEPLVPLPENDGVSGLLASDLVADFEASRTEPQ